MTRKTYREHQSINDYVHIFTGLLLFAVGSSRRLTMPVKAAAFVCGASKIAEGITGYSPLGDLWRTISFDRWESPPEEGAYPPVSRTFPWEKQSSDQDHSPEKQSSASKPKQQRPFTEKGFPSPESDGIDARRQAVRRRL